jgi:cell division protein FtsB
MSWKELKERKWFKVLSNKYLLLGLFFAVWMFFLDSNSWLVHRELDEKIDELDQNKAYYQKEIAGDKALIEDLNDRDELEEYAREHYFMKRKNEEIFIIEYQDSLKNQPNE